MGPGDGQGRWPALASGYTGTGRHGGHRASTRRRAGLRLFDSTVRAAVKLQSIAGHEIPIANLS
jgi:hypothetical protein